MTEARVAAPSAAPAPRHVFSLRSHLAALLIVAMLLIFALVGGGLLAWRLPQIEESTRLELNEDVQELGTRLEMLLRTAQVRLETLEYLMHGATPPRHSTILEQGLDGTPAFVALYRLSRSGEVTVAALAPGWRSKGQELLGGDFSSNSLFRALSNGSGVAWSGRYRSALDGARTVAVAVRDREDDVLVAELPFSALLRTVSVAAGRNPAAIWIVDRSGEVIVDTAPGGQAGRRNIGDSPLMQSLLQGRPVPRRVEWQGQPYHAAVSHAPALDWYVVGRAATGLANPDVRGLVLYVAASFAGCLLTGLVIAPIWAARMVRPLRQIVDRAEQTASGRAPSLDWPSGPIREFNHLSGDLAQMERTLEQGEQKSQEMFNASPVAMSVSDANDGYRILDVNAAWCRTFRLNRHEAIGRVAVDLGLWAKDVRDEFLRKAQGDQAEGECMLLRSDGQAVQARVFVRIVSIGSARWVIWASVDIGPLRRVQQELRELNQQLELRVQQRTQALADSHDALTATLKQLRQAQAELVHAEKMAALGQLVAGVSHELNTPLGNGVMAVSAMADAVRSFRPAMQRGLRRSELDAFIDGMEQGTDIAQRNLLRSSDLVQNFKQVAVDQTSAQRRRFELGEVVHEMVVTLRPSFQPTPYRIEVDVPGTGLLLDSYPGALGQAIGNLMHNALLHGFAGRGHGTVRIEAERADDGRIVLRVRDDGNGIAPELIERVFEPFVTTRMGSGGTGLGLHISFNAVVNLLGGTLTVQSTPGQGACFEMRLPAEAPHGSGVVDPHRTVLGRSGSN